MIEIELRTILVLAYFILVIYWVHAGRKIRKKSKKINELHSEALGHCLALRIINKSLEGPYVVERANPEDDFDYILTIYNEKYKVVIKTQNQ